MKKILVIRLSSIGDVVLTAPILRAMRLQAGMEVHLLTKPGMGDLLRGGDAVDKFYTWGETGLWGQLKAEKYDGILDLHKNWRSLQVLLRLLYLDTAHAFSLDWPVATYDKKRFQRALFVKTKSPRFEVSHVQERYLSAANALVQRLTNDRGFKLSVVDFRGGLPEFAGQDASQEYGVAILGGTYATKKIPISVWQKVFRCDARKWVLIGGKNETPVAEVLVSEFGDQLRNEVGSYGLLDSVQCIAGAALVVGGDTGFSHVAAAYGRPLLVIWGNTHPGLGFAAGKNNPKVLHLLPQNLSCHPCTKLGFDDCPKGHFRCMNDYSALEIKLLMQKLQAFS
ncbi:MAG: glycosyltransferase family 9 protein [Bacteroidota bacterium]